jgi:Glycosyltransferase family 87
MTRTQRQRLVLVFWAIVGPLCALQGFIRSLRPARSIDLHVVYAWFSSWLWQGVDPYSPPPGLVESTPWWTMQTNYPPYAIVFLSPLALLPPAWVTPFWSIVNLFLLVVVIWLAFRVVNPAQPLQSAVLPGLIFLAWVGMRVGISNGQFSLLAATLGLSFVLLVDKRPVLAGVLLGLSLSKPHVGAAFFLWTVVTRRFKPALIAIVVVVAGLLVFSARIRSSPVVVMSEYLTILRLQFGGESYRPGDFELRPMIHWLVPNFSVAELMNLALVLGSAGLIALIGFGKTVGDAAEKNVVLLQLCCLWALMSTFHYSYDVVLLLPVVFGLYLFRETAPSTSARRHAKIAIWILQTALLVQIAGRWRDLSYRVDLSAYSWLANLVQMIDRVIVVGLFVFIAHGVWQSRLIALRSRSLEASVAEA